MAQPRGQPSEGGEVVVTPQGVPVLVQRRFDSAEGTNRLLQHVGLTLALGSRPRQVS
jgi:hypothetical protein